MANGVEASSEKEAGEAEPDTRPPQLARLCPCATIAREGERCTIERGEGWGGGELVYGGGPALAVWVCGEEKGWRGREGGAMRLSCTQSPHLLSRTHARTHTHNHPSHSLTTPLPPPQLASSVRSILPLLARVAMPTPGPDAFGFDELLARGGTPFRPDRPGSSIHMDDFDF